MYYLIRQTCLFGKIHSNQMTFPDTKIILNPISFFAVATAFLGCKELFYTHHNPISMSLAIYGLIHGFFCYAIYYVTFHKLKSPVFFMSAALSLYVLIVVTVYKPQETTTLWHLSYALLTPQLILVLLAAILIMRPNKND
jgi:hypothetical protein